MKRPSLQQVHCMAIYCLILLFLLMLWMAAPRRWPFTRGSVQLRQVTLEGQEYAFLQGEAANYMGLMQVIGVIESGRDI